MTIEIGQSIPEQPLTVVTHDGPVKQGSGAFFAGKNIVLFAVPGAFTPTCSARHLPGYKDLRAQFSDKGVDVIACTSVNDPFVMKAWAQSQGLGDEIIMLADGSGDFARSVGLTMDAAAFGMGERSQRYAMIINNGVVKSLFLEEPGAFKVSAAEYVLENID
jgi:peroxiredoxin